MSETDNHSKPVECYEFVVTGIGVFRHTSDETTVIAEGKTYTPMPGMGRSEIGIVSTSEAADMTVTLPVDSELARRVALIATPDKVTLAFRRYQRPNLSSPVGIFDAILQDSSVSDDTCTLKFPDAIQNALARSIPGEKIQSMCNNQFGDEDCGADLDDPKFKIEFTGATLIAGFHSSNGPFSYRFSGANTTVLLRNLVGATFLLTIGSPMGPQVYKRTINQVFSSGGGAPGWGELAAHGVIYLNQPLPSYTPNSVCEIIAGCSKDLQQCTLYGQSDRFFGFPYVPTEKLNPFRLRFDKNK